MKILIIDNYDSFTYNIYNYICIICKREKISFDNVIVVKNDDLDLERIKKINPTHIIFGPGQGTVYEKKDIGNSEEILGFFKDKCKIFGICLGHQLIYKYFGGEVISCDKIMHGKQDNVIINNFTGIFSGIGNKIIQVMRYHSQIGAGNIPKSLEKIAMKGNILMGIKHRKYDIWGVQFHPESI